jgi:hypothetical protein
VESILYKLYQAANYDLAAAQQGIVYLDEVGGPSPAIPSAPCCFCCSSARPKPIPFLWSGEGIKEEGGGPPESIHHAVN